MANNQMTIDELAIITKAGFDEVHENINNLAMSVKSGFDEVHQKFNEVNQKMDGGFNAANKRFDKIEERLDGFDSKLIFIQREIEDIKAELEKISNRTIQDDNILSSEVVNLKQRIIVLERQVKQLETSHS